MAFGEVGGLYDFGIIILSSLFGFVSNHFLFSSLVQKLFLERRPAQANNKVVSKPSKMFFKIEFGSILVLLQAYGIGCCYKGKRKKI